VSLPPARARERVTRTSQVETEPKSAAHRPRVAGKTCHRRESLGTDSRDLRLIQCFDTPENAFRAKIFLRYELGCTSSVAREKICRERSHSCRIFASR